jgi:mycothiol synthase
MMMWRSLSMEDSTRLSEFITACRIVDGEDLVSNVAEELRNCDASNTLCAVSPGGSLVAAGWIKPLTELRIAFGGKIHPGFRKQGLGGRLIAWAEDRATELRQPGKPIQLVITNESLGEDAHRLYEKWGFEQIMAEEMRVSDLTLPFPSINLPDGMTRVAWSPETVLQFFQAYQDSFRDRPGFPHLSAQEWINSNLESEGFRPGLSILAQFSGIPVGFLTAEVFSGLAWISQVGVAPAWRGKGLAKALIVETLQHFREEGFKEVALHVNVNNPQAINLYSQLGFVYRLKRARYVKEIEEKQI